MVAVDAAVVVTLVDVVVEERLVTKGAGCTADTAVLAER